MKNFVSSLILIVIITASVSGQPLNMDLLKGLKPRNIGPAGMSGRVTAIDVVLSDPSNIYVGTASGGLWHSDNGGVDWEPIFDDQPVASIGALAIYQRNPSIIWAGTGEGNPRNSQTSGGGIFRSLDGGRTWKCMGLEETRNIHRVIIHPENPDIVFVGAQGNAWADSEWRGIYKTTDGGETWEKILYANSRTGIADLVIDPANPNKLIAAMWEFRRWPWFFKSGGAGSGIFVTHDGGKTWDQRTHRDGLPEGDLGRIGLAIAPSKPEVVYALVESKKNALYRSEDGGFKWKQVSTDENMGNRPFYYYDIFVDPENENRLWSLWSRVSKSEDGGKTFEVVLGYPGTVHPDHHAMWIHPQDGSFIIEGNDGGLNISHDRGETWRFVENLPLAQFYHISVDDLHPYHVYGGMQDNGSWRGPSYVWRRDGIRNSYWEELFFGDGFDVVPDPEHPERYGYAMSQGGNVARYDLKTGNSQFIAPLHPEGEKLRFNWNAAIAQDPSDPATIYYGSQYVHKSTNRGYSWTIISPDLTTNDTSKQKANISGGLTYDATQAENYVSILSIAPSPVEQGVIWVGTDDGNVQLTRDGGESWKNLTAKLPDAPENGWVAQIQASTYEASQAFVVINNYRQGDWTPYLYHTKNYGRSWTRLAENVDGYCLSVIQDPVQPNLIFLGTEFGLYVSIDAGENWTKWTEGYPTVSTMDLAIQAREKDLVIGTFGRAAWVMDDIEALRRLASDGPELLSKELVAFAPPTAYLIDFRQPTGMRFPGNSVFSGENRRNGAMLTVSVLPESNSEEDSKEKNKGKLKVEVFDADNALIRTFHAKVDSGINRFYWNLRSDGVRGPGSPKPKPETDKPNGPEVVPGTYKIRYSYGNATDSVTLEVKSDPRLELENDQLRAKMEARQAWNQKMAIATQLTDQLRQAKETVELVQKALPENDSSEGVKSLKDASKAMLDSIKVLREQITGKEDIQGIYREDHILRRKMNRVNRYLNAHDGPPNPTAEVAMREAEKQLAGMVEKVNGFFAKDWADYQEKIESAEVSMFKEFTPINME